MAVTATPARERCDTCGVTVDPAALAAAVAAHPRFAEIAARDPPLDEFLQEVRRLRRAEFRGGIAGLVIAAALIVAYPWMSSWLSDAWVGVFVVVIFSLGHLWQAWRSRHAATDLARLPVERRAALLTSGVSSWTAPYADTARVPLPVASLLFDDGSVAKLHTLCARRRDLRQDMTGIAFIVGDCLLDFVPVDV